MLLVNGLTNDNFQALPISPVLELSILPWAEKSLKQRVVVAGTVNAKAYEQGSDRAYCI